MEGYSNPADYKEYVLGHYLLPKAEWWAVNLTTMALEFTKSYNGFFLNQIVQLWNKKEPW